MFSVYQTDIIYYGANLSHYFENETSAPQENWERPWPDCRYIRFWSDLVERNNV